MGQTTAAASEPGGCVKQLLVKTEQFSYPIQIGFGALKNLQIAEHRVLVLCDSNVAASIGEEVVQHLKQQNHDVDVLLLPAGESCKTTEIYSETQSKLAQLAVPRDAAIVSVGGGATSDLVGFVAATYLRGVAFYSVPTTLLAMVDASVGGKTGINLKEGKNLTGAFYQPRAVCMDVKTLAALPEKIFREGASEMFKHGLLAKPSLCQAILQPDFSARSENIVELLADAVQVKIDVVSQDPFEKAARAHLNLGHTLAHALEAATQHQLSHGQAVAYGMHYALLLAKLLGLEDNTGLSQKFLQYQKPEPLPELAWQALLPFMARDKKTNTQGLRFVVLERLGQASLIHVNEELQQNAFAEFLKDIKALGLIERFTAL